MSNQSHEYKSENLTVGVENLGKCKVKLDISVSPHFTQTAYLDAIKAIKKEVSIPGFRKGKAPNDYIVQHFSKHIDSEWKHLLINEAIKEAIQLTKLYPFQPKANITPELKAISKESGSSIVCNYETFPEVPLIDLAKLKIEIPRQVPITEKMIEDSLQQFRLHHATWTEINDRPVQEEDFVDLDISVLSETTEKIPPTSLLFEVSKMPQWMRNLIIGKHVNESTEGMSEKDPLSTEDQEFTPTLCRLTIKRIKKANLPDLNDELAAKSGAKTVEELKQKMASYLEKHEEQKVKEKMIRQIQTQLVENYPFDLPASLIENEAAALVASKLSQLNLDKNDQEAFLIKMEEIEQQTAKELEDSFRLLFLEQTFANSHQIQVTNQEIVNEYLYQRFLPQEQTAIDASWDQTRVYNVLQTKLLQSKVENYIIEELCKNQPDKKTKKT